MFSTLSCHHRLRSLLPLLALSLLTACAQLDRLEQSSDPAAPYYPANARQSTVAFYYRPVDKIDGWRVWEHFDGAQTVCLAVKPADGAPWPNLGDGFRELTGAGGFAMVALKDNPVLRYFFYGPHPAGRVAIARIQAQEYRYIDDQATVLGFEGERVEFEVSTLPLQADDRGVIGRTLALGRDRLPPPPTAYDALTAAAPLQGAVDFSGVTRAHEALLRCWRNL